MPEPVKKHRPASWIWTEYQDGKARTIMENERGATFTRNALADIGERAYAELEEYFFACPPEIPIDDFKATLKFLKFLKTLTDEDVWETSGEERVDASIYTIE